MNNDMITNQELLSYIMDDKLHYSHLNKQHKKHLLLRQTICKAKGVEFISDLDIHYIKGEIERNENKIKELDLALKYINQKEAKNV